MTSSSKGNRFVFLPSQSVIEITDSPLAETSSILVNTETSPSTNPSFIQIFNPKPGFSFKTRAELCDILVDSEKLL